MVQICKRKINVEYRYADLGKCLKKTKTKLKQKKEEEEEKSSFFFLNLVLYEIAMSRHLIKDF